MSISRVAEFVAKVNRLTQEGRLDWVVARPPRMITAGTDSEIAGYYQCVLKGKTVALYEERSQAFQPDFEQFYWTSHVILALLADDGRVEWEVPPDTSGLNDLWNRVRLSAGKVSEYVNAVLSDD
jgi:hypothetical protein